MSSASRSVIQQIDGAFPCRCAVQLSVLGYILVPIIRYNLMWLVLLYAGFMLIMGSLEAAQSPTHTYKVPSCCCWKPSSTACHEQYNLFHFSLQWWKQQQG